MANSNPPRSKTQNYAKLRTRFGLAFVVSTLLFVIVSLCALSNLLTLSSPAPSPTLVRTVLPTRNPETSPTDGPAPTPEPLPPVQSNSTDLFALLASIVAIVGTCLTSLTTLAGFIITAAVSFRQERREAKVTDLERQMQEVELEKRRLELEKLKRERDEEKDKGS